MAVVTAVDRVTDLPSDLPDRPVVTELEASKIPVISVGHGFFLEGKYVILTAEC